MNQSESETSYRAYVQRYAKTNQLSQEDYDTLETYRAYLKLLPAQARRIEQEVLGAQKLSPVQTSDSIPDGSTPTAASSESRCAEPAKPASAKTDTTATKAEVPLAQSRDQSSSEEPAQQVKKAATPAASPHQPGSPASLGTAKLNAAYPAATDTTMMPPKSPEQYLAHRQQYREALLHAHQAEGFLLKNSTLESLRKKADELQLSPEDVDDITKKLFEFYMTNNQPVVEPTPTVESSPPTTLEEKYHPDLHLLFDELEGNLKAQDLQAADIATLEILLKVICAPTQNWLDEASLRSFSASSNQDKNAIQEIDHLWDKYSNGNFGFSQQLELYGYSAIPSNDKDLDRARREHHTLALAFSRSAQWWIDGLEFFKYYSQLDFTTEAPKGHLPAWWFWKIPRSKAFQYGGLGILKERGGCRVDAYTLPAFMYVLKKCGIKPR